MEDALFSIKKEIIEGCREGLQPISYFNQCLEDINFLTRKVPSNVISMFFPSVVFFTGTKYLFKNGFLGYY